MDQGAANTELKTGRSADQSLGNRHRTRSELRRWLLTLQAEAEGRSGHRLSTLQLVSMRGCQGSSV